MMLERPMAPDPYSLLPKVPLLEVDSPDFAEGAALPPEHSFAGGNVAPTVRWSGAPEGAAEFLVTCFDPDAPTPSGFWHWVVVGVPAELSELTGELPTGASTLRNDYGSDGYGGAAPPPGDRPHRYIFAVTALDTTAAEAGIEADTPPAKAHFLTLGHVLARGTTTATFQIPAEES